MTTPTRACQPFRCLPGTALAFLAIALFATSANAQSANRPELSRITGTAIQGAPLSQRLHTVVLKMTGDPVAVVRSRMPGKQLAEADRLAIQTTLGSQQDAIVPAIEAMGGKVLAKFQHAINGIKVQGTPDQIKSFAALPGVVQVKEVRTYSLSNAHSVPFIGAPSVWHTPPGLHGEHVRIAVIDTGIDYTHANFGGPGTVTAFNTAFAKSKVAADPKLFGPKAPKVKGGIDLVGDLYDANKPGSLPVPDPNPLDCNGHGSHTSGTAAGFGVTSTGATFKGPYDAATPSQAFTIGPGVAPLADLYAVRVFGCAGSTNVVVDGIDWAIAHDMQVISMSLGADYGTEDDADAEASENAVDAGIVVAAASGNSGPIPYITSDPGSGEKAISVAAMDSHDSFPGETLKLSPSGKTIVALDANGIPTGSGPLPVVVLPDAKRPDGVSLGCALAEYKAAKVTGSLVVTARGSCARVARAIFGQEAGAAAVAMINNAAGYPPYEGPINSNPDDGVPYTVTIPFLGVQGPSAAAGDGAALKAAKSATFASTTIVNPTFRQFASFSSGGPRSGDGHLKPNIAAPGVSVFSTAMGTGTQGVFESGTSMATPHVAGSAALAVQAHPHWSAEEVSAALVNTADSKQLVGYSPQLGGNGLVQPFGATRTSVTARAQDGTPSVSFGVAEFTHDFTDEERITLENHDRSPASFAVSVAPGPGSPHTATPDSTSITVSGHESATLHVKLAVPVATTGDSSAFRQVQGQIVLTPTSGNNGVTLAVPYYLVPRARSIVKARLRGDQGQGEGEGEGEGEHASGTVALTNGSKSVAGSADFYAWGLRGDRASMGSIGLRAVGVQSYDLSYGKILQFAVNTFGRTSNPTSTVYDLFLDVNGDGVPDYQVEVADLGLLTTGVADGLMAVAVFNLATTAPGVLEFLATAPTDGSTVLMPLLAADVGITSANPRFSYVAQITDLTTGNVDTISTSARFNAFNNSISTGALVLLAPGASTSVPMSIDRKEFARTPALGEMVVSLENMTKDNEQALLLHLGDL